MQKFIDRLTEPSSYAGIAAFLASMGAFGLGEDEWKTIFGAVAAVAAALAVFLREKGEA